MCLNPKEGINDHFPVVLQLEPGSLLPPPNALKKKILIKNKRLKAEEEKSKSVISHS